MLPDTDIAQLIATIQREIANTESLLRMQEKLRSLAKPGAGAAIANEITQLIQA